LVRRVVTVGLAGPEVQVGLEVQAGWAEPVVTEAGLEA
jgi:hypothetical protein